MSLHRSKSNDSLDDGPEQDCYHGLGNRRSHAEDADNAGFVDGETIRFNTADVPRNIQSCLILLQALRLRRDVTLYRGGIDGRFVDDVTRDAKRKL